MKQETPSRDEALQRITSGQIQASPLEFCDAPVSGLPDGAVFDASGAAVVAATWEEQAVHFAVEYHRQSTPRRFQDAVLRAQSWDLPEGVLPLVIFPWLKPEQLSWLDETGLSGLDLCGNMAITVRGRLKVFRCGQKNEFRSSSPIRNIYRGRTSLVARLFALEDSFERVQEIRDAIVRRDGWALTGRATNIGLSTVSKSLKVLEEDLLISRSGESKAIRVVQRDQLLDRLVVEDLRQQPALNALRVKLPKADATTTSYVASALEKWDGLYVATGLTSAVRYTTMQRGPVIQIYSPNIQELATKLGGEQVDRFEDVVLIESKRETDYFDIRSEGGFSWSSPLQCYLELMGGDKRDVETAVQVRELLLRQDQS